MYSSWYSQFRMQLKISQTKFNFSNVHGIILPFMSLKNYYIKVSFINDFL